MSDEKIAIKPEEVKETMEKLQHVEAQEKKPGMKVVWVCPECNETKDHPIHCDIPMDTEEGKGFVCSSCGHTMPFFTHHDKQMLPKIVSG